MNRKDQVRKYLYPREIYFSQDSISNQFSDDSKHANVRIGKTLDDLYEGKVTVLDIPPMEVVYVNRQYFTLANRRLWVFHWLEQLGLRMPVPVWVVPVSYTSEVVSNFTTSCLGTSIQVRGYHGSRYLKNIELRQAEDFVRQRLAERKEICRRFHGKLVKSCKH